MKKAKRTAMKCRVVHSGMAMVIISAAVLGALGATMLMMPGCGRMAAREPGSTEAEVTPAESAGKLTTQDASRKEINSSSDAEDSRDTTKATVSSAGILSMRQSGNEWQMAKRGEAKLDDQQGGKGKRHGLGINGIGISAAGRGAGGTGRGNLGALNTIGHGCGGGAGISYGRGAGGFGGRMGYGGLGGRRGASRPQFNTEKYKHLDRSGFSLVTNSPLSTFSIDVDTASYANVRRFINGFQLPPVDAVRLEEMINYFEYEYAAPDDERPFAVHTETTVCPWNDAHWVTRVGLKGKEVPAAQRPAANLVFLIDVSGSMGAANKLLLLQSALKMLASQLTPNDKVALVVYAGASGLVLDSTSGSHRKVITNAIDQLRAGGSTNGGAGIQLAYRVARQNFIKGGINRVVLATDGDFNVGTTGTGSLIEMVQQRRKAGVSLSVLGFGMGNYNDALLEQLADKGNGNYAYIDSIAEARKVLVKQMNGTLMTIAKDVKIQIEFNPKRVGAYRLLGYENRMLAAEDFKDDTKDAGEIGAGHTVTALYELVPPEAVKNLKIDNEPLRYQTSSSPTSEYGDDLYTLKLRHKTTGHPKSVETVVRITGPVLSPSQASADLKFSLAVAGLGMKLRKDVNGGNMEFGAIASLAKQGVGADDNGYRREFVQLVRTVRKITASTAMTQ